jgi:ribosome-interacting GTPase 1
MPANLSPEYKAAEAAFRRTREPRARLECLREMLRTIPKHKGTEHLQADLKARIKDLSEELEGPRKGGGAHGGPTHVVHPEGAAQITMIGPPNAGKSLLHARLTGSGAHDAPYAFTTQMPAPGMMPYEDVHFQLVDMPAVSPEHPVPWLSNALQTADAALLVLDLDQPSCVEQLEGVHATLRAKHVTLTERWDKADDAAHRAEPGDDNPFLLRLSTLVLANKSDRASDPDAELEALREVAQISYPALAVSAATGHGLGEIAPWLFRHLGIVRAYTKAPHRPPDKGPPFTLRKGQMVRDLARCVHKDLEKSVRFARIWGRAGFDGQQVGPDHALADGDIVELHT